MTDYDDLESGPSYGQFINPETGSPGDDAKPKKSKRKISKKIGRKLEFTGDFVSAPKRESICEGVSCTISGGRRSRKRGRKRGRKRRRKRGGVCFTKKCREKRRSLREEKQEKKMKQDAENFLYSLAYDVCPTDMHTTKAEYDKCVDSIVNPKETSMEEVQAIVKQIKRERKSSNKDVAISPPPGIAKRDSVNHINPMYQQAGKRRRRRRRSRRVGRSRNRRRKKRIITRRRPRRSR